MRSQVSFLWQHTMESLLKIVFTEGLEYGMSSQVSSFLWCRATCMHLCGFKMSAQQKL